MKKENSNVMSSPETPKLSLKREAGNIGEVLFHAQESMKVLEALLLHDPDIDVYDKHRNYFWHFTTSVYADQVLLKLNILLSPKEHFSIHRLIGKLKRGGEFEAIVSDTQIELWEKEIIDIAVVSKNISTRRNKLIAHKDRGYDGKKEHEIRLADLKKIILLVQHIVKEIYHRTIGGEFLVDSPIGSPVGDLKKILATLNEERRGELKPVFDQARTYGLQDELPPSERY